MQSLKAARPLAGLLAFSVTPLAPDESIDEPRLRRHIDDLVAAGVNNVTVFGSTGAIGSFTEAERMRVAEIAVDQTRGRATVMVGTGAMTTAEAIRLARHAERIGADAILVVPITYWILNERELVAHYTAIHDAVGVPLCLYNNPRLTGVDLVPALIARLADLPRVKYLKESSPEILRIPQVLAATDGRLTIFAGRDAVALEALSLGAHGWAAGTANVMPRHCLHLLDLMRDKRDVDAARRYNRTIAPLADFLLAQGLVRTCHAALDLLGKPVGDPRRPILPLDAEQRRTLAGLLDAVGRDTLL